MSITNFRAEDFNKNDEGMRVEPSKRDKVAKSQDKPEPTKAPIVPKGGSANDVPVGTLPEILSWVGDDVERAQRALDKELEDSKPRKGLVAKLSEMVETESESDKTSEADED